MKKLDRKDGIIHFNRFTGAYGASVYIPDNVDILEWVELPESDVRNWEKSREKRDEAIREEVQRQLKVIENDLVDACSKAKNINIEGISISTDDIKVDESTYEHIGSCKEMFKDNNINIYNPAIDTEDIIREEVDKFNNSIQFILEEKIRINQEDSINGDGIVDAEYEEL